MFLQSSDLEVQEIEDGYCGSSVVLESFGGVACGRGRPVARSGNGGRGVNNKCGPNYWVVGVVGCLILKCVCVWGGGGGGGLLCVY